MDINESFYRELLRIRLFEVTVLDNFQKGVFHGTTHTYLGQEANAVGVLRDIQDGDVVFSNHRSHGHFLAYGGNMRMLFAEMMGKTSGICGGRGGSQHLQWRNFFSNGIQGGIVPIATGMAFAEDRLKRGTVAICFLGDGTLGQGVVYETLNMASLWSVPILYIIENNRIAQTTPIEQAIAGSIAARFTAFNIQTTELESIDVLEIHEEANRRTEIVRFDRIPQALILHTNRLGPHSKGDDTRDPKILENLKKSWDPLLLQGKRLQPDVIERITMEIDLEVREAFQQALQDPLSSKLSDDCYSDINITCDTQPVLDELYKPHVEFKKEYTVLQSLNQSLNHILAKDDNVIILGEDILDPYGGAFKMTKGLSTAYPDRVMTTPISEAGMVGVASGMALRGLRPVVEIMFGDFLTLAADQIINHVAKFYWMYDQQVVAPILIRTPMGGRRGYGPTHSQTLEKLFLGVPGLVIIAPCDLGNPGLVLVTGIKDDNPVLFIENKLLYNLPVQPVGALDEFLCLEEISKRGYPYYELTIRGAPAASLTLVTYGYMGMLAREAALKLAYEHEIFPHIIILTQLSPFDLDPVKSSVGRTGRLLTLEEGTHTMGWGTEVIAQIVDTLGPRLRKAKRLAAKDFPIPAAISLEKAVLPDIDDIIVSCRSMVDGNIE